MEQIKLSRKSFTAADEFYKLYKAGKVFDKNRTVRKTCEVYLAANKLADAIGRDIARHTGEEDEGYGSYEILYNLKMRVHRRVSKYYCAEGVYDTETRTCYYAGIRRC
jgi:hypothetical protein